MRTLLLAIMLCMVGVSSAKVLDADQALQRALNEPMAQNSASDKARARITKAKHPKLAGIMTSKDEQPAVYMYNYVANGTPEGYMLVSADDCVPAVLGYSETGTITPDNMPEGLRYWLDEYANQIEYARAHTPAVLKARSNVEYERDPILPMCTTKWNQDEPFNNMCPIDATTNERSYVGCAATALAQVMAYHKWPTRGTGSHSYTTSTTKQTVSANFNVTYDWANMLDYYTGNETTAQNNAVALLSFHCGVSIDMNYTSNASGALIQDIPAAISTYFGYDASAYSADRSYYTLYEWQELAYNNLRDVGPAVLGGFNDGGGHAFVCDGYSSNGYFHINWGWGGNSDGYFLLSALDPDNQGIGGSASGYTADQVLVLNIKPNENGTATPMMGYSVSFGTGSTSVTLGQNVSITGRASNIGPCNITGSYGYKIASVSNPSNVQYVTSASMSGLQPLYGYAGPRNVRIPTGLAAGQYKITPVWKVTGGSWQDMKIDKSIPQYILMTVSGNKATFSTEPPYNLSALNLALTTPLYKSTKFCASFQLANTGNGEFNGELRIALINSSYNLVGYSEHFAVVLQPGETIDFEDYLTAIAYINSSLYVEGNFLMCIIDNSNTIVSDLVPVTMGTAPATTLSVSNVRVASNNLLSGYSNFFVIPSATPMEIYATVNCSKGFFADNFRFYFFPLDDSSSARAVDSPADNDCVSQFCMLDRPTQRTEPVGVTSIYVFTSKPVIANEGDTANAVFHDTFAVGEEGHEYFGQMYYGGNWWGNQIGFVVDNSVSGVDDIKMSDNTMMPIEIEFYSLTGISLGNDPTRLPHGLYIMQRTMPDGTRKSMKVRM